MLKYRLTYSFILIFAVVGMVFLLPVIWFTMTTLAVCTLAAWEWSKINSFTLHLKCIWLITLCVTLLILALVLLSICNFDINKLFGVNLFWIIISLSWWIFASVLVFFYPYSAVIWRDSKVLRFIFGMFTIIPFFWGIITLRIWKYDENCYSGILWILYVMILVWGADSGAYIFGKLLGNHKLIPKVSPNKTWQGFIGGLFTAETFSFMYYTLVNLNISYLTLLICSILTTLISVTGDLYESMFKREAGIKDSSKLIPGHGGILDLIDSLIAAVPIFTCLLLLLTNKT